MSEALISKCMVQLASWYVTIEERVSPWESYISPTTSVGINPGQFILLNLLRLAQIVIVSWLRVNGFERSAIQARIIPGIMEEEKKELSGSKIDAPRQGVRSRHREKFILVVGGARPAIPTDKRKYDPEIPAQWKDRLCSEFKRDEIIVLFILLLLLLHIDYDEPLAL